ncbi:MAG: MBL fold metallo-hydrolase [Opitutaceae bacterium]|jgi:phosphoribosyl 1,2-cyclic phosphate phosphodiesterase|nr:MBL fold metallo-hydrolase [Opitutaceae bacterium]
MEIIVLGSGTSHGVPMIGCACAVCRSTDPRDRRTRASVHVVLDGLRIQIDATPEFRLQALAARIPTVDLFVLTHGHADHILGMDDLRRYCDARADGILPVYCTEEGEERVRAIYPYALRPPTAQRDGYARFDLRRMPARLELPEGVIETTPLPHGRVDTLGLVFTEKSSGRRFAYYTDCKEVPEHARTLAKEVDLLIMDGLRPQPHPTHQSIPEAVAVAQAVGAKRVYLTHLAHSVAHAQEPEWLPAGMHFAHDGLSLSL